MANLWSGYGYQDAPTEVLRMLVNANEIGYMAALNDVRDGDLDNEILMWWPELAKQEERAASRDRADQVNQPVGLHRGELDRESEFVVLTDRDPVVPIGQAGATARIRCMGAESLRPPLVGCRTDLRIRAGGPMCRCGARMSGARPRRDRERSRRRPGCFLTRSISRVAATVAVVNGFGAGLVETLPGSKGALGDGGKRDVVLIRGRVKEPAAECGDLCPVEGSVQPRRQIACPQSDVPGVSVPGTSLSCVGESP
ncbi:hypothetical protein AB0B10_25255 [Micromonospora arborensis]|uniref:hypothetical protein n=1 Tax=Micromonospora arborensis TaxID=2116518 RepID=UPI0033C704DB